MDNTTIQTSSFRAGMYLLDSFTSGMYNDPLIIYREYIQNAVDSIDVSLSNNDVPMEVTIQLDPIDRKITIRDNAMGVSSDLAENILSSVGSSSKSGKGARGFRGIGRLGGIAFCDRAVFRTKAKHELLESIQEWDCQKLKRLLAEQRKESMTLEEILFRITSFRQEECQNIRDSYFEVVLYGVSSFRNQIFDLERVRRYLSQVAPVPFNSDIFSHSNIIEEYLSARLSNYGCYKILLNGEVIYKPYKDSVKITKGNPDKIDGIEFFEIGNGNDQPLGYGWYGRRRELLGSISRGDDSSGVRVRVGNIQIGDGHLLDFCYREPRFNSYIIGEVHVNRDSLIPNSRRDDFVDNPEKGSFYNLIEKEIGLPISKDIRLRSRLASIKTLPSQTSGEPISGGEPFSSDSPQKTIAKDMLESDCVKSNGPGVPIETGMVMPVREAIVTLQDICQDCHKLPEILSILGQEEIYCSDEKFPDKHFTIK